MATKDRLTQKIRVVILVALAAHHANPLFCGLHPRQVRVQLASDHLQATVSEEVVLNLPARTISNNLFKSGR